MDYPFMPKKIRNNPELLEKELEKCERRDKVIEIVCYVTLAIVVITAIVFIALLALAPDKVKNTYEYEQNGTWVQADYCRIKYGEMYCRNGNEYFKVEKFRTMQ